MQIDRYTKAVLTVIAGALVYLCAMTSGRAVAAQAPSAASLLSEGKPQAVVVVGWGSVDSTGRVILSTTTQPDGVVRTNAAIPVNVAQQPIEVSLSVTPDRPLPVGITSVQPVGAWEPLRTRVEPEPSRALPGPPRP